MIPLKMECWSDARAPFVAKLSSSAGSAVAARTAPNSNNACTVWASHHGLVSVNHGLEDISGDVVLIDPMNGRLERLLRKNSPHNTLLVTEQCDQLCVMCSQPPKKSHVDRLAIYEKACLLADEGVTIGLSGGEPILHKAPLFEMLGRVLTTRPDLSFHILSNGQHFEPSDISWLSKHRRKIVWGVPIYSAQPFTHDRLVGKIGAFEQLLDGLWVLLQAGQRIELRTVLMKSNVKDLPNLSQFVARELTFIEQWSLMGLENTGFARNRWRELSLSIADESQNVVAAVDTAERSGISVKLFNYPLCSLPVELRDLAVASISDWKTKFAEACATCRSRPDCSGFFEWHPEDELQKVTPL